MSNPVFRGYGPHYTGVPVPEARYTPADKKLQPAKAKRAGRGIQTKWWLLLILLITILGGVLYWGLTHTRAGYRHPVSGSFRLSGNFGELRSQHFHMGLDVRTNGEEDWPVLAVAEGYVSRVLIEEYGLGKAVFISHPQGYTTVYAHLNRFYPALEAAITASQYAAQKREVDIHFTANKFPISKGQLIAHSGNTGGSEAPHLHFEMRHTASGNNINPLKQGYELADEQPPVLKGLYWYNRQHSTYRMAANAITLQGAGGRYKASRPVIKVRSPRISLGILAEDKSDDSRFRFGIYRAECRLDEVLVHSFQLDELAPADSRYINACIDYPAFVRTGRFIQHLSTLPGNHLPAWKGKGILDLSDGKVHRVSIRLYDINNNVTAFENDIQFSGSREAPPAPAAGISKLAPGREHTLHSAHCRLQFPVSAFYDTVYFALKEQVDAAPHAASPLVNLHSAATPVHGKYQVSIKAKPGLSSGQQQKVVMQLTGDKKKYTVKGTRQGDWYTASFQSLGSVQLLVDDTPPVIETKGWETGHTFTRREQMIKLICRDETGAIATFRAELDGHWVLFEKKGTAYSIPLPATCATGKHNLVIQASDVAGNTTREVFSFYCPEPALRGK